MKKIIVSVSNDLITDQRVHKVCSTLSDNGFFITLVGCKKAMLIAPLERNYDTKLLNLIFTKGVLFYAEFNIRLFFFLLFNKKDVLLSNDMDTLLPNYLISRLQNKTLVFDSHELFSEIPELVNRKFVKNVWLSLEKNLIPKLKNAFTVCVSIAKYYKEKYNTDFKVIRNVPKSITVEKRDLKLTQEKDIIIYQGAVNVGRGLELMIDTMMYLPDYLLLIVGDGDIKEELFQRMLKNKVKSNVFFYGKTSPEELKKITPNAVLGFSMEEDLGLNYRFALPNKIFDYIQAEIPVLCSDLPEMKKIIGDYKVGEIVLDRTPEKIALQIREILKKDFSKENFLEMLPIQNDFTKKFVVS